MLSYIIRYLVTGIAIYFSYLETGIYTAVIFTLMTIAFEIQTLKLYLIEQEIKKAISKKVML